MLEHTGVLGCLTTFWARVGRRLAGAVGWMEYNSTLHEALLPIGTISVSPNRASQVTMSKARSRRNTRHLSAGYSLLQHLPPCSRPLRLSRSAGLRCCHVTFLLHQVSSPRSTLRNAHPTGPTPSAVHSENYTFGLHHQVPETTAGDTDPHPT